MDKSRSELYEEAFDKAKSVERELDEARAEITLLKADRHEYKAAFAAQYRITDKWIKRFEASGKNTLEYYEARESLLWGCLENTLRGNGRGIAPTLYRHACDRDLDALCKELEGKS